MLPSSHLGFLNVRTDGRRKDRHNREVQTVLAGLLASGVTRWCMHHVNDGGMDHTLPLTLGGRWYDIAYEAPDGEIFLIEVMRLIHARGPATCEDGTPWQKERSSSP